MQLDDKCFIGHTMRIVKLGQRPRLTISHLMSKKALITRLHKYLLLRNLSVYKLRFCSTTKTKATTNEKKINKTVIILAGVLKLFKFVSKIIHAK